jgi:hypothetical protein
MSNAVDGDRKSIGTIQSAEKPVTFGEISAHCHAEMICTLPLVLLETSALHPQLGFFALHKGVPNKS